MSKKPALLRNLRLEQIENRVRFLIRRVEKLEQADLTQQIKDAQECIKNIEETILEEAEDDEDFWGNCFAGYNQYALDALDELLKDVTEPD